ncbi:MAG TPA: MFS transporter [Galbitalea sp.]|jgi:MFS family permease|nr:MFS transporter [Galbitalea sp.]
MGGPTVSLNASEMPSAVIPPPDSAPVGIPSTKQNRLIGGLVGTNAAGFISLSVPQLVLLTTHLTTIAGPGATAAFSLVSAVGGAAALVANPFGGRISDRTAARWGRRRTWILTGGVVGALLLLGMGFTTAVWQVALVWAFIEIVVQFQLAASSALAADQILPEKRGSFSGIVSMVSLGGPVIGFGLVSVVSFSPVLQWTVLAVLSLLGVILAFVLVRDPQHQRDPGQARFTFGLFIRSYWVSPRRHPAFGWAWFVRLLITAAWSSDIYFASVFTTRFNVASKDVTGDVFILTLIGIVCVAVTAVITGTVSDRVHRQKPFIFAGGILLAIGLLLLAFAPSPIWEYVSAAVMSLGYGTFLATDFAMCIRVLPNPETFGKDFGVLNIANTLPGLLVPSIALVLLPIGGFVTLFISMAVLAVIGAVIVARIPDIGQEGDPRFAFITRLDKPAKV